MMYCVCCGLKRPNNFKSNSCPKCKSYLKYVEAPAKSTVIKFYRAGLAISYTTAEVYSYANCAIHTTNINIGLAKPYQASVFRELPNGFGYVLPSSCGYADHVSLEHLIAPVRTYGMLRYEIPYLDHTEAKTILKKKLRELDAWVDVATDWLAICNLAGLI